MATQVEDIVFVGLRMPVDLAAAVKRQAVAEDRSMSATIRELLRLAIAVKEVGRGEGREAGR